jgi:hypothetical protein
MLMPARLSAYRPVRVLRYSFAGARKGCVPWATEAPWRSWLARRPVTAEVAGSSPVGVA